VVSDASSTPGEFRVSPGPAQRPPLVVSACLLGVPCNDRGRASPSDAVRRLGERYRLVPVCPEMAGGLPSPRPAAAIASDGTVRTADGSDVTEAYERGAGAAVAIASATGATAAVLKARSPSCGCHEVYEAPDSHRLRPGEGVTAAALRRAGLTVVSEEDVAHDGFAP
jgi:uncharacterized protein YbbK (DUF523 family)